MTGGQMNDFIGQIAEAYQALQAKPELEAQIKRLTDQSLSDGHTIASLETRIHSKNEELASLDAKVRSLEVERDQAQFQVLELEERLNNISRILGSVGDTLTDVRHTATVSKPEPTPEAEPVHMLVNTEAQNDAGQSANPPSIAITSSEETSHSAPVSATETENASSGTTTNDRPYSGKAYHDHPVFVNYNAWLEGGGTDYGYNWRPGQQDAAYAPDPSRL